MTVLDKLHLGSLLENAVFVLSRESIRLFLKAKILKLLKRTL